MNKSSLMLILMALSASVPLQAHHSRGAYDIDNTVEIDGVVTQVNWRNPHVYISVRAASSAANAQPWILEGHSISGMLNNGWRKDSVKVGDRVLAVVNPGRSTTRPSGLIDHIRRESGETYFAFRRPPDATGTRPRPPDIEPSTDFSGNWAFRRPLRDVLLFRTPDFASMPLTASARARARDFDANDNPAFDCRSSGIPRLVMSAYAYRWIRADNRIVIEKEQASRDDIRTIYLDGRKMPAGFEPNPMGFSTGRFEQNGNVLLIETIGFSATPWGIQMGVDSSTEKRLLEKYRLTNGGLRMIVEYTVEDPVNLLEPMSAIGVYDKDADREFVWEPCDVDTARQHLQLEQ